MSTKVNHWVMGIGDWGLGIVIGCLSPSKKSLIENDVSQYSSYTLSAIPNTLPQNKTTPDVGVSWESSCGVQSPVSFIFVFLFFVTVSRIFSRRPFCFSGKTSEVVGGLKGARTGLVP